MLRATYTLDDNPVGGGNGLLHGTLLALLVAGVLAHELRMRGRGGDAPLIAFVLLCVVSLYIAVLFSATMPYVCNELLLPTRPLALLLIWSLGLSLVMRGCSAGLVMGAVVVPSLAASRTVIFATWLAWRGGEVPAYLNVLLLGMAFLLTVCLVAYFALANQTGTMSGDKGRSDDGRDDDFDRAPYAEVQKRFGLSDRETQVLELLVEGNTRKKIADMLVLSVNSIQTYVKSLYRKMDVHSRQELIDYVRGK